MRPEPIASRASLLVCVLAAAAPAPATYFAHEVGSFKRGDGELVTAFEKDYGSPVYTHTRCWFVLPDGTKLAVDDGGRAAVEGAQRPPAQTRGCAIQLVGGGAEIYRYASSRLPIAASVQGFDGHAFTDVTTPEKRWRSPLVHVRRHWSGYLMTFVLLLPPLFLDALIARKTCGRGWWRTLRRLTIGTGLGLAGLNILLSSVFGSHSPLIHLLVAGSAMLLFWGARNLLWRSR
jgi:hypothetical protein